MGNPEMRSSEDDLNIGTPEQIAEQAEREGFMTPLADFFKRSKFRRQILQMLAALSIGLSGLKKVEAYDAKTQRQEEIIATRVVGEALGIEGNVKTSDLVKDLVERNNPSGIDAFRKEGSDQNIGMSLIEKINDALQTVDLPSDVRNEVVMALLDKVALDFRYYTGVSLGQLLKKDSAEMTTDDGEPGILDGEATVGEVRDQIIMTYLAENPATGRSLKDLFDILAESHPQLKGNLNHLRRMIDTQTIQATIAAETNN